MACHTVNMPFRALKLGYPTVVEYRNGFPAVPETFPKTSRIRYEFPAREGLPPLKFWWYDGNPNEAFKPIRPPVEAVKEIISTMSKLPESGALVIGDKGKLFSPDDYGARFLVAMKGQDELQPGNNHDACKEVPKSIPRSPGHMQEWFRMMKEGTPAYSNFEIAAYLTEILLLGCVALHLGEGVRMEWDWTKHEIHEPSRRRTLCEAEQPVRLGTSQPLSCPVGDWAYVARPQAREQRQAGSRSVNRRGSVRAASAISWVTNCPERCSMHASYEIWA